MRNRELDNIVATGVAATIFTPVGGAAYAINGWVGVAVAVAGCLAWAFFRGWFVVREERDERSIGT